MSSAPENEFDNLFDASPKDLAGARAMVETIEAVQVAYEGARKKQGLNQQKIATRLGLGRATVNKRLLGRENMTLRTLGELAWAMGYKLTIQLEVDPNQSSGSNIRT